MRRHNIIKILSLFLLCVILVVFIYSKKVFRHAPPAVTTPLYKDESESNQNSPSRLPAEPVSKTIPKEGGKVPGKGLIGNHTVDTDEPDVKYLVNDKAIVESRPEEEVIKYVTNETDYVRMGIANLREGNYEEAVDDFRNARMQTPDSSVAAFYLGVAYKKIQDYKEARLHLKDALQFKPPVKEAVAELADVLFHLGEVEETLKTLSIAETEGIESAQTGYLKGLVLLKTGRGNEAIGFFKKARSLDDRLAMSADYQIALANLQEGNLAEAREIFREIVIRDPNSDIAQGAAQYIDAITKRLKEESPLRLVAGLQYQYDDNVILKPGDVSVAGDIADEADSLTAVSLRGEYVPKMKGPLGLKAQYSFYLNGHFDKSNYDIQSHTISLVPNYNLSRSQLSFLASYNYTMVDDYKYLRTVTISPAYMLLISDKQIIQSSVKYLNKDYQRPPINGDEDRDSGDTGFGLSWFYLIADGNGFINTRYDFNREDTDGANWKYHGNKIGAGLLYPLMKDLNLNIGGEGYFQDFEEIHTVFGRKRDDKIYTLYTMVTYKLFSDVDLHAQYVFVRGDSNIALYDYDKSTVTFGIETRLP